MDWRLSFSNQSMKVLGETFPRLTDVTSANHGVQVVSTHSTQQSWQVHAIQLDSYACGFIRHTRYGDGSWLFLAVESYSRFTLLTKHEYPPTYTEWLDAIREQYWRFLQRGLEVHGLLTLPHQIKQVQSQFAKLPAPTAYRNYDQVLGGIASDVLQWLWAYLHDVSPPVFGEKQLQEFIENVNCFKRTTGRKSAKNTPYHPYKRFIEECLYRFANGLCPEGYPGGRAGNFPNPHHRPVQLSVVR